MHGMTVAAMVALPSSMRPDYVKQLLNLTALPKGLMVTFDYPQEEMQGPPYALPDSRNRSTLSTFPYRTTTSHRFDP